MRQLKPETPELRAVQKSSKIEVTQRLSNVIPLIDIRESQLKLLK